jgi:PAS domain S-box-containing protein
MKHRLQKNLLFYFIVFIVLVSGIITLALYYYNYIQDKEKQEAYNNLSILAEVKISEIVKWRNERLGEAKFLKNNTQFKNLVSKFLKYPQFNSFKQELVEWLRPIKENHEYFNISLIDISGNVYSLFKDFDSLDTFNKYFIQNNVKNNEISLSRFVRNPATGEIFLSCFIPLTIQNNSFEIPLGVLELRIDPQINLYPLIKIIPTTYKTAESFLVRQDGDSVTFLNELKFRKGSALRFKLPLSSESLPAAMVIKGKKGIVEGFDYTGKEVLADLDIIPGSPWFIVSIINLDEVYAPVRQQALYITVGVVLLILLSASVVFIAWRGEKIKFINKELRFQKEKKDLFKNMSEGYAYCKLIINDGRITDIKLLEINEAFKRLTGFKNAVGTNFSKIIPRIQFSNPEIFKICSRVAIEQTRETFENYFEFLNKWFRVSVYSPEKEFFVAVFSDITEQKNAFLSLRKLSRAVEQSPASVVITDLNGSIEYVNSKFTEVTGYTFDEVIGKNPRILNSGLTPLKVFEKMWKTISKGNVWSGEFCNKKKNGELFWELSSISPIKNESGVITHYVAVKEDITKQKLIEDELKSSEERFRKMFENHKAVMLLIDPDSGSIVDANPAAVSFYGYPGKTLCSMSIQDINQLSSDQISIERQKTLNAEKGYFLFPHKLADGTIRTVEVYSSPLKIKKKHLLFSIIHDITERKKAEDALRESEEQLKKAQEISHLGSWELDLINNKLIWSDEVYRIFGLKPQEFAATYEAFLEAVHPEDREAVNDAYSASIRDGKDTYEIEHRVIRKVTGEIRYVREKCEHFRDKSGKIIRSIGMVHDITEPKETILQLEQALKELERSNKELEQFAYTASHDLQEPIRMIRSYAQILEIKNKKLLPDSAKEPLSFIIEGAARMQHLVNDLLKFSRLSTAKKDFEKVDCNLVVKDVLEDLRFTIQEVNACVKVNKLPVISGDYTQLRQLFQNFIQNAIKFRSDKTPEIEINCKKKKNQWLFSLKDNGIGIDSQFYERIFVIFQRLNERDKYPGTGIGLSICKKIIERHGGNVYVDSEINKGSTFYFTIPIINE